MTAITSRAPGQHRQCGIGIPQQQFAEGPATTPLGEEDVCADPNCSTWNLTEGA
jgi:hypothetical protein